MRTLLFKTYGDSSYGMGHVYRSIALSQYFDSNNINSYFVVNNSSTDELFKLLNKNGRKTVELENLEKKYDYLVYDMPFLDFEFFKLINHLNFNKKIGLDFFHYESKYVDISLNLFNHKNAMEAPFQVKENIQYAILRDSILLKKTDRKQHINNEYKYPSFLITFGSSDPQNNTCAIINQFNDCKQLINIILGPLFNKENELNKSISRFSKTKFNILKNVSNIEDYMIQNDLIICGGGTTLLEALYLKKPAIVLAQTIEELNFAKSLAIKNHCKVIDKNTLSKIDFNDFFDNDFTTIDIGMGKQLILNEIKGNLNG